MVSMNKCFCVFNLLLVTWIISTSTIQAQSKFLGGVLVGGNVSQITGDEAFGYNKFGFIAGVRGGYRLKPNLSLEVELLFSQKGSKVSPRYKGNDSTTNADNWRIALDYFEIPVIISFHDWMAEKGFYRLRFYGGLSIAYLFQSEITNEKYAFIQPSLSKSDLSFLLGATYFMTKNLGITGRYTRAINKLWKNPTTSIEYSNYMRGYHFSLAAVYMF